MSRERGSEEQSRAIRGQGGVRFPSLRYLMEGVPLLGSQGEHVGIHRTVGVSNSDETVAPKKTSLSDKKVVAAEWKFRVRPKGDDEYK